MLLNIFMDSTDWSGFAGEKTLSAEDAGCLLLEKMHRVFLEFAVDGFESFFGLEQRSVLFG